MAGERVATNRRAGGDRPSAKTLPIDEIARLYPGEWVAVKVIALDEEDDISHGQVLAHSPVREDVSEALLEAHRDDPAAHTYVFAGGQPPATAQECRDRLAEAAALAEDYLDARW